MPSVPRVGAQATIVSTPATRAVVTLMIAEAI